MESISPPPKHWQPVDLLLGAAAACAFQKYPKGMARATAAAAIDAAILMRAELSYKRTQLSGTLVTVLGCYLLGFGVWWLAKELTHFRYALTSRSLQGTLGCIGRAAIATGFALPLSKSCCSIGHGLWEKQTWAKEEQYRWGGLGAITRAKEWCFGPSMVSIPIKYIRPDVAQQQQLQGPSIDFEVDALVDGWVMFRNQLDVAWLAIPHMTLKQLIRLLARVDEATRTYVQQTIRSYAYEAWHQIDEKRNQKWSDEWVNTITVLQQINSARLYKFGLILADKMNSGQLDLGNDTPQDILKEINHIETIYSHYVSQILPSMRAVTADQVSFVAQLNEIVATIKKFSDEKVFVLLKEALEPLVRSSQLEQTDDSEDALTCLSQHMAVSTSQVEGNQRLGYEQWKRALNLDDIAKIQERLSALGLNTIADLKTHAIIFSNDRDTAQAVLDRLTTYVRKQESLSQRLSRLGPSMIRLTYLSFWGAATLSVFRRSPHILPLVGLGFGIGGLERAWFGREVFPIRWTGERDLRARSQAFAQASWSERSRQLFSDWLLSCQVGFPLEIMPIDPGAILMGRGLAHSLLDTALSWK